MKYNLKILLVLFLTILISACEDKATNPDYVLEPDKTAKSYGCGNIFVYQYLDASKVLTVKLDGKNISLKKESQTVNLDNSNPYVRVVLEIAGNDPDSNYFNFCNDVASRNMGTTLKYEAISGELTYSVSEDNPILEPIWQSSYTVTVKIKNLYLYNHLRDNKIIISEITFMNVRVGWLPG